MVRLNLRFESANVQAAGGLEQGKLIQELALKTQKNCLRYVKINFYQKEEIYLRMGDEQSVRVNLKEGIVASSDKQQREAPAKLGLDGRRAPCCPGEPLKLGRRKQNLVHIYFRKATVKE